MQGKLHCQGMIVVAGYQMTIAMGEHLYLNSSRGVQVNGRLQQTHVLRIYLVEQRYQSSTGP